MTERVNAGILLLTILAIVFHLANLPAPVKAVQVDYCVIDYPAAFKDRNGGWVKVWARGYGLCSELDRYEFI